MDNDKYIGRLLDNRYEILEVIGVGGMAVVYKARCHRLNRLVAIKILKDDYSQDEEFRRRFHAEGQAVAMVGHPNIVSVYDVSTSSEADYIVMELIDGISLKQYMEKKGVLNWKETLHFAIQIGKALEHAHSRGIVHRDIKPHNVMVLKNGSVKVADFGIARVMSESNTLTREALGSVHYISPEQAKGGRVDDRSDLYSLGVVMYEMITGRPPYDGESPVAVAIQHINGGAKMPSTLNPNIPGGLEQIIMKAMAHDPAARYASAAAMLYDMDEFRKLPSILFDYNVPPIDDVTRISGSAAAAAVQPPRTTAERVASTNTDPARRSAQPPRRTAAQMSAVRAVQKNAERAAQARRDASNTNRRRREEEEEENDRSKIATIAIIICSLVAVFAIVIFLVTLLGGNSDEKKDLVSIPTLIGKSYETLQISDDFVLNAPQYAHSDTYEKGQIMEQSPLPGEKVEKGYMINITVSLGVATPVKTMEDLVGQERTIAENFLTGQGMLPLCKEENSDTVEAGLVTRTEPAAGEELTDGQTVTLYISKGPEIQTIPMVDVVGQNVQTAIAILQMQDLDLEFVQEEEESLEVAEGGVIRTEPAKGEDLKTGDTVTLYVSTGPKMVKMPNVMGKDISVALEMLEYAGFTNIKYDDYVDSDEPENQVVNQSQKANTEIPINAPIVLQLSKGPTEPVVVTVTKNVVFTLPDGMTEAYTVKIYNDNGTPSDHSDDIMVHAETISDAKESTTVTLKGSGVQNFEVYLNDVYFDTVQVIFE